MAKQLPVGIDLGTVYSSVAVYEDEKPTLIFHHNTGKKTTPSVVSFCGNEYFVGEEAKKMIVHKPHCTVYEIKRIIGRPYHDKVVRTCIERWTFEVINITMKPSIRIKGKDLPLKVLSPEEIISKILGEMKKIAEEYLTCTVTEAVITVPAQFNDSQRQATLDAARLVGLDVLKLLSEPTAAAIAVGLGNNPKDTRFVLVYDFGGGTFDVAILRVLGHDFEVLAVDGDTFLGGVDIDAKIAEHFYEQFKREHPEVVLDKKDQRRLNQICEKVKINLSHSKSSRISLDVLSDKYDFESKITREDFDDLCDDIFAKTIVCVKRAFEASQLNPTQIDDVILVGGSSKIPKVQKLLGGLFPKKILESSLKIEEAVAQGAAIQAAILKNNERTKDVNITDVLPLSIGIEDHRGEFCNIIKRNSTIPCSTKVKFSTWRDSQTMLSFKLYEGEHSEAKMNTLLGKLDVKDLEDKKAGEVKFEITLAINVHGILTVEAHQIKVGNNDSPTEAKKLTIELKKGRLTAAEIQKKSEEMKKIGRMNEEEVTRQLYKNRLEALCRRIKLKLTTTQQNHDKGGEYIKICEQTMQQLKNNTFTTEEIKRNYDTMMEIFVTLGGDQT